jgi:hypothetical protein
MTRQRQEIGATGKILLTIFQKAAFPPLTVLVNRLDLPSVVAVAKNVTL